LTDKKAKKSKLTPDEVAKRKAQRKETVRRLTGRKTLQGAPDESFRQEEATAALDGDDSDIPELTD